MVMMVMMVMIVNGVIDSGADSGAYGQRLHPQGGGDDGDDHGDDGEW